MPDMLQKQQLLTLSAPLALEDALSDFLLESPLCKGFSSTSMAGHSENTRQYSVAEQVTGKQKRIAFYVQGEAQELALLVAATAESFSGVGLHYWIVPVMAQGSL
ncbi:MAG: DUF3240 family protein [bacterium]